MLQQLTEGWNYKLGIWSFRCSKILFDIVHTRIFVSLVKWAPKGTSIGVSERAESSLLGRRQRSPVVVDEELVDVGEDAVLVPRVDVWNLDRGKNKWIKIRAVHRIET